MKHLLILTGLFFCHLVQGQVYSTMCDAVHVPISTNSSNPAYLSSQLPLNPMSPPNPNPYINGLNWNDPSGFTCTDMSFAGVPLVGMTALTSTQTSAGYYSYIYYSASAITHKHLPSEGWELLSVNFGRYPNNVTQDNTLKFRSMPFILLYNRYQGIVRVFVSMGTDKQINENADAIAVNLKLNVEAGYINASGLLRLYSGHDQALDIETSVTTAQVVSKAVSAQGDWASCDFQVAFDPCVCHYPSEIYLEFSHMKTETIKLYGRSVTISDDDIITNELSLSPKDFLSGYTYNPTLPKEGNVEAGVTIEKAFTGVIDEYIARYEKYQEQLKLANEHNEKVTKNLALLRFAKQAIIFATTYGSNIGSLLAFTSVKEAGLAFSLDYIADGEATTLDDGNFFTTVMKSFQSIVKNVSGQSKKIDEKELFKYLKMILGSEADAFITKNFELTAAPAAPSKPTNTIAYTEMRFDGSISVEEDWSGVLMAMPGTYGKSVPSTLLQGDDIFYYPNYNEQLGIFALLETPKIKFSKTIKDQTMQDYYTEANAGSGDFPVYGKYHNWTKSYQIQLEKDLVYALNNVLDIKSYDIKAAFRVKAKRKMLAGTESNLISNGIVNNCGVDYLNAYLDPQYITNFDAYNTNVDEFTQIKTYNVPYPQINNYLPRFYEQSGMFSPGTLTTVHKDTFDFETPYLPINAFKDGVFGLGIKNESFRSKCSPYSYYDPNTSGYDLDEFDIELKLIIDIEFYSLNESGLPNTATQLFTYKIQPGAFLTSDVYPNLETSVKNISQYPENINFQQTTFSGQAVPGCKLNTTNNTYTCRAWNDVEISGNLDVTNPYKVDVMAGHEIYQVPETYINPEIILSIAPVLNYSSPMPQATQTYVSNFCKGLNPNAPAYRANVSSKALLQPTTQTEEEAKNTPIPFAFNLFPNPASGTTTVAVKGTGASEARILLFDITGKAQNVKIDAEGERFQLDISALAKGIYLVKVSTFGESITKQLIIK